MPELDKWQQREARKYADDNEVTYEAAVKVLFPDAEQADEDEGQDDEQAPAAAPKTGAKVDTAKTKS